MGSLQGLGQIGNSSKASTPSQKSIAQQKVIKTVKNDVIDLPRTGSALKIDEYHARGRLKWNTNYAIII